MNGIIRIALVCFPSVFAGTSAVAAEDESQGVDLAALEGWDIIVATDAIESEIYAAEEFQNYYVQAAGVKLPINRNAGGPERHIFIGPGSVMQSSDVGFSVDSKASGAHSRCVGGNWKDYGLDHSVALKGLEAFDQAMKLAENDTIRTRVEKMSICAYRAALEPIWYIKYTETDVPWMMQEHQGDGSKVTEKLVSEMRPYAKRFFELCEKFNVKHTTSVSDRSKIEVARKRLEKVLGGL